MKDAHIATRVNTTNGIAHKNSPSTMSPSHSNPSFASLKSSHSFHNFHVPHIKFHSFHGNHEHSKSWQVRRDPLAYIVRAMDMRVYVSW